MHDIFYKCHIGSRLSDYQKKTSRLAFQYCGRGHPAATSDMKMYWGRNSSHAHDHKRLKRFFEDLGNAYYQFVDAGDLGSNSYSYEVDDLVESLKENSLSCTANGLSRKLEERNHESSEQSVMNVAEKKTIGLYNELLT